MDKNFASGLRSLIDHLALRGVSMLSVRQGGEWLRIELDPAPQSAPVSEPVTITAAGPGIFRARHPGGAALPCIEAGDFLFPAAGPLREGDEVVAQDGAVVGYGTPLIHRISLTEETGYDRSSNRPQFRSG